MFLCVFLLSLVGLSFGDVNYTIEEKILKASRAFQVIRFPNDSCNGGTRNGTCFTADECSGKGGTNSGSCANGFGVCCTFDLSCGGLSSYNNTYFARASTSTFTGKCEYTICPASTAVCRIRFDFTTFNIATPYQGLVGTTLNNAKGSSIGTCVTDLFTISSPGAKGSPIICGENGGQHMIVDAPSKGYCVTATFQLAASTGITRSWDVKVTQYDCGNMAGGPPGCLQYFTGTSGSFASYNFGLSTTTVINTVTHLALQNYDICIRRESGYCTICYITRITPAPAALSNMNQYSFGLSISAIAGMATSVQNTQCSLDYLVIPGGRIRDASLTANSATVATIGRICGRQFSIDPTSPTAPSSICTRSAPFKLTFVSNSNEVGATPTSTSFNSEEVVAPGGTIGFYLNYNQYTCSTVFP